MTFLICTLLAGVGATAITDLWALARKRVLGVRLPDYGLVGRWFGHMPQGRFRHASIAASAPVAFERVIGWTAHYLVGIGFAALLLGLAGLDWIVHPTPGPALAVGLGTVAAPLLVMQPGMGAGIAASRTPRPGAARLQSLVTHGIFGLGLYLSGLAISLFASSGA